MICDSRQSMDMAEKKTVARRSESPGQPLYQAICDDFVFAIKSGVYSPNQKLPSVRDTSSRYGVSIPTVIQAYGNLEVMGLVEARERSGYFVLPPQKAHDAASVQANSDEALPPRLGGMVRWMFDSAHLTNAAPIGVDLPSLELYPVHKIDMIMARICRSQSRLVNDYCDVSGLPELRQIIARRLLADGCPMHPDDIIITSGGQEALQLCLRATTRPGDTVVVESPTYYGVLLAAEALDVKVIEVPSDPQLGLSPDVLEALLDREKGGISAVVVMPNFSNPTGCLMPDEAKKRLVKICVDRGIPLIEDDTNRELYFGRSRPLPLRVFDPSGNTVLCSSFSKTISPGLRVGFAAPGRFLERTLDLKFCTSISTATLSQLAAAEFLGSKMYERHLKKLREAFSAQIETMIQVIDEKWPENVEIYRPRGGYFLWMKLPENFDCMRLHTLAQRSRINIAPGAMFTSRTDLSRYIRLNAGRMWSPKIERAVNKLGDIIRGYHAEVD